MRPLFISLLGVHGVLGGSTFYSLRPCVSDALRYAFGYVTYIMLTHNRVERVSCAKNLRHMNAQCARIKQGTHRCLVLRMMCYPNQRRGRRQFKGDCLI